jgi:endonuclease/exonuclease/phosphatase family metal-dependent hydrolase
MRLLLYNIRYAVGGGASMHMPLPGAGYVLGSQSVLPEITKFVKSIDPDIVGLIEVDTGSIRSRKGNAFMAAPRVHGEKFHYFDTGIKRLIIELEMEDFAVFLVHLSLKYRHRHLQLRRLYDLIEETKKPVIVAGDFNTFWGENEIYLFMRASKLKSANTHSEPTYPSRAPRKELDFILYQDGIDVTNFEIPQVKHSDHLPLVCDFETR